MSSNIDTFTNIYENCSWGDNNNDVYKGSSGDGSSLEYNLDTYIPFLKDFITSLNISSVVDLGCGDFICGKYIYDDLNVIYYGYDAYDKVIKHNSLNYPSPKYNFEHLDFCGEKESIKSADLCIIKDVLQHWTLKNIYDFLDYLVKSKKFKYILICNCCMNGNNIFASDNTDINTGEYRPLSCFVYPLKSFNPIILYTYNSKEVSVINLSNTKDFDNYLS